jgi:capsule polysaccharide export protein KpsC/LpsZ
LQDDFVLFPIHFKPEASTSVYARHYCDDIAVIRNIAFNLPFKMKLYVKEHFVNYGRASVQFYKALKQIPNVRLISCEENIKDLIKNCKAVITLTSTVGFEALLMNKLVLVFGEIFYQCHPNCYKIKNYEDLFDLLQNNSLLKKNPEINRKFIAAYRKMTFEGNIYYQLSDENNFVERFKAALYKKYEIS